MSTAHYDADYLFKLQCVENGTAEIRTIAAHSDARASQCYKVSAATAREPGKFTALEKVKVTTPSGATEARILGGEATRGIVALRFEFENGPLGYNLTREITVQGAAAPQR